MDEDALRKAYRFEADYGDGRGFVAVEFTDGGSLGWDGNPEKWVKDSAGHWKAGGAKALRVKDGSSGKVLHQCILDPPELPTNAKIIAGTAEFRPSPPDKAIYSNMMNIGVSQTEVTIDFGRIVAEKRGEEQVNVGNGQVAVIMPFQMVKVLRDTLDSIMKSREAK